MKTNHTLDKRQIKRILVIRLGKIGDVLLTTPLLRNLRKNFPRAYIAYIVGKKASPVLNRNPWINKVIISDRKIFSKIIEKKGYDLAIDLNNTAVTAPLAWLSRARYRVGAYKRKKTNKYYNILLSMPGTRDKAVSYFSGQLLKKLGLAYDGNDKCEIYLMRREKEIAQQRLKRLPLKIAGIQPACTLERGGVRWSVNNFAKLADHLINEYGLGVVIFQTPEQEKIALKMKKNMRHKAVLLPVLNLREYLAVLSKCNLFVGNDGGQLHLAQALGVPTIALIRFFAYHNYWWFYKDKFRKIVAQNIRDISVSRVLSEVGRLNAAI